MVPLLSHTHAYIYIYIYHFPTFHINVWLPAACARPCKIPQTLMKSIDVECGDIRVEKRQRDREKRMKGQRENEVSETASQNRKNGQCRNQSHQKFTQTSITTQSRVKINKNNHNGAQWNLAPYPVPRHKSLTLNHLFKVAHALHNRVLCV